MDRNHLSDYFFEQNAKAPEYRDGMYRNRLHKFISARLITNVYPKNLIVQVPGNVCDRIYFVDQGAIQGYDYDLQRNSKETLYLWNKHALATDALSFSYQHPGDFYMEIMANSTVSHLGFFDYLELIHEFSPAKNFSGSLKELEKYWYCGRFRNYPGKAAEKLEFFRHEIPGVELYITKGSMSSFVGVSREHLSRKDK
ncbi:hypothetical protein PBAL39_12965 [Pedobacter sp. BAL39]|uniref:hypothetical protein n=1 Tax=Pedobacter sp. BAL39 TaxID=391596 RepID=UPI0001559349|nr:hypothetical protein [Pedobacter sp. BAL39]EDM35381.1 hypothetical protein PBAL39_12965 [Pedobacter sp. BAL39]